jgi:hypothetical protein
MNALGINSASSVLSINLSPPQLVTGIASLVGFTLNPILGAAGALAFGVSKIYTSKRKAERDALAASNVAYLLSLNRGLKPRSTLGRLSHQLSSLM